MNLTNLHKSDPLSGARLYSHYIRELYSHEDSFRHRQLANGLFQYLEYEYRRQLKTLQVFFGQICACGQYIYFFFIRHEQHTQKQKNIYTFWRGNLQTKFPSATV